MKTHVTQQMFVELISLQGSYRSFSCEQAAVRPKCKLEGERWRKEGRGEAQGHNADRKTALH